MTIQIPQSNRQLSSRTKFLKQTLNTLNMQVAQKALNLMIEEMCSEKGFSRSNSSHYYHHVVDVTQKLLNFGVRDEGTIIVSILHDAIEDTWITFEYIEREYGREIAEDVLILTKDPNIDYKKDKEALEAYLIRAFSKLRTALVKAADRIHNFGTLGDTPLEKQLRVALDTEENFIPLFKWAREEYPEFAAFFFQAKTEIEPHLQKIKESAAREEELLGRIKELEDQLVASKVQQMESVVESADHRGGYRDHLKDKIETIEVLRKRNVKVETALEFYGKKENHWNSSISVDQGEIARKALEYDVE